jgi:YD repeat-containing protein
MLFAGSTIPGFAIREDLRYRLGDSSPPPTVRALAKLPAAKAGKARVPVIRTQPETRLPLLTALLGSQNPPPQQGPPLSPAPGGPRPWQSGIGVYKGLVNLATGNLQIAHPIAGWHGKGPNISFAIFFNSQSSRTSTVGPKWTHSYNWFVDGSSPATVVSGDGRETTYTLSGSDYVAPVGIHEKLEGNASTGWTLTFKNGTVYSFNSGGRLTSIEDANGNVVTLGYRGTVLTEVEDASGRILKLGYTSGRLSSVEDSEGRIWSLSYDGSNRVTTVTDPTLDASAYTTSFGYGSDNNVTSVTDRLSNTWSYSYGSNSVFTGMTDPNSKTWGASYSDLDDPNFGGGGTQWPAGVAIGLTHTAPDNTSVVYGFNSSGHLLAQRDQFDEQTEFTYDSGLNRTSVKLPSGATTTMTYDGNGNLLTVTNPLNKTTTYTYDANNNLLSVEDPLSNETTYTYDSANNLLTVTDPTNNTTTYTYNGDGTRATKKDADNNTWSYDYDSDGHLIKITDPLSNETTFVYDCCQLISRTDARNRTTEYEYDDWGRRVKIVYPDSADVELEYDAEGRLISATDGTGTRTFTYDAWGRKTYQTDPRGNTSATYDDVGNLTSQTDVTSRLVEYDYDAARAFVEISDPTSSVVYTYDVDGRVETETYSNGTRAEYTYDSAGRLTALVHRKVSDNSVIMGYTADFDDAGRLIEVEEAPSRAITTYTYDAAGRLLTENRTVDRPYASTYTYNSRGLRATAFRSESGVTSHDGTYSYNVAGWLTDMVETAQGSKVGHVYTWHPDGTLASYPGPGYTRVLDYDEEGRLISIARDNGSTVTPVFEYGYAFDGAKRWRKDLLGDRWDWYPCGVQCCAGELVALTSDLSGQSWSTLKTVLPGGAASRHGSHFAGSDMLQSYVTATDSAPALDGWRIRDAFGVDRHTPQAMPSDVPAYAGVEVDDEFVLASMASVGTNVAGPTDPDAFLFAFAGSPITNAACIQACKNLYPGRSGKHKRLREACIQQCKQLGARSDSRAWCNALSARIKHLMRHRGNKHALEAALALYNSLCSGIVLHDSVQEVL